MAMQPLSSVQGFQRAEHLAFIRDLDGRIKKLDYWQADCLRMSGIYWALTALLLLDPSLRPCESRFDTVSPLSQSQILAFVFACQCMDGGFGGNIGHDAHVTFTLSALQILFLLDALDDPRFSLERHLEWLKRLQNSDGSFSGDEHGEVDSRFSYCVIASLKILNELHQVDLDKALDFISHCTNADGGFGAMPGGESHAGQIFCCLGVLSILDRPVADADRLSEWLAWRQLSCGGLNGRPEKLEDVCYSWWVLSSLEMLGRRHWIDEAKLQVFILSCQDPVSGGFSDRPGDVADIFHTLFGIAGLSLLQYDGLAPVDPRYCLPRSFTQNL